MDQRTFSVPTAAQRTTWPSALATERTIKAAHDAATENASTSDTSPASPATASDDATRSPKTGERARRYTEQRDQEMRRQIRDILLEAQPKMFAVESLKCISLQASSRGTAVAPGKNVAAK